MASLASCAVPSVMATDPRFQALKEAYKDKHYCDDHIAQALQLCRERYAYDDDWYPETPAQRGVFTRFMNYYLTEAKISKTSSDFTSDALYNLYTTMYSIYTPEQLDNRIGMLAHNFRDIVDWLEKQDRTNRTRQQLIMAQSSEKENGYTAVMRRVFEIYERDYTDAEKMLTEYKRRFPELTEADIEVAKKYFENKANEYKIILKNKERLAAMAAPRIGEQEGFVVNIKNFEVSFTEYTGQDEDNLTENGEVKKKDEEESKGDRYSDFRILKLLETLGPRTRRLISSIPKMNSDGTVIRDDIGCKQYMNPRQVASTLNKVLVNSTPDSLMSDLEAAADFYPWMRGLIDLLNKDEDAKTTIYDNFKKAETTYVYVNFDNGSYRPRIANSRAAGNYLMREAGNNIRAGYVLDESTSIYTGYGALKSLEEIDRVLERLTKIAKIIKAPDGTQYIKMVEGDKPSTSAVKSIINSEAEKGNDVSYLALEPEQAMAAFLNAHPDVIKELTALLRGVGFNITEKNVRDSAFQKMSVKSFSFIVGWQQARGSIKGRNKLYQLVDALIGIYGQAGHLAKENKNTATGQYLYNTSPYDRVTRCLALSQYGDVEARVVNEGKALSAYNPVNLLHQVFDALANRDGRTEEQYQEDLWKDYLRYEGMALGFGEKVRPTGWLKRLARTPYMTSENEMRSKLRVLDVCGFNHVEYERMSREQKLTNSLVMFFNMQNTYGVFDAAYEVPIQADYSTAYNFITAPVLSNEELIDELTDEVLIELERISSLEARLKDDTRVKLNVREEQGLNFQIFPELNSNGFRERYSEIEDAEAAREFVKTQVAEQIEKVILRDIETINQSGILTNPAMRGIHYGSGGRVGSLYAKDGKFESLDADAQEALRNCFVNIFYARQQITKIVTGGMEQFNGLIDYEKRNMMTHATRTSLYTEATWKGKKVGKETQNVVYIGDDSSASNFLSDIKEMLKVLKDENIISSNQYDTMVKAYSKIKTTDGQGFRTLESYRTVMIMADQWDDRHESAYKRIMDGNPTKGDIDVFMQNIKPVLTGYETVPAAAGENQKPIKLTLLHKYSEQVLLPVALARHCIQAQSVPLQALDRAQAELKKQGKEIDLFLFHSGVKVGAHSIMQPFAKDKNGERKLKSADAIQRYIEYCVKNYDSVTHTLSFKYYGIAASTPAHPADDKIAWASQAEKVAWANIMKGQKITVNGKEMDAWEARETYFAIKTANIVETYKELRKIFTNSDELEKLFQDELSTKSYYSSEIQYALAHLKDGKFAVPLFSPNVEHQVQELLSSIIKKRLTKTKLKGANILQATGLGMDIEASAFDNTNALSEDDKLSVVFEGEGKNKRIKYVEVFLPLTDSRLKLFANSDGTISPKQLRTLVKMGFIDERVLNFIAYRTPSDAEHSVIPCRVKGFIANTGGATIIMPKEIMVMTGHDYDGDKMRCHFPDFKVEWDDKRIEEAYNEDVNNEKLQEKIPYELKSFENYKRYIQSERSGDNAYYKKISYVAYDYGKTPLENSVTARNNARIELMFSQLTSVDGSKRVLIPGGCDESKVIAKSLYLVRVSKNEALKERIKDKFVEQGMDAGDARAAVSNYSKLYEALIRKSDDDLSDILREVSSTETPFSLTHSVDAFEYIMEGAEMIGIYAVYNSGLQMLQRVDMSYVPRRTHKGKPYNVTFFGHTWWKLFDIKNHRGRLASLGLARLLNAAVDNGKDPILGYLHQNKQLSELTFMMFAAGMTEEEIHLIMNQPAVIKLIERMKARGHGSFIDETKALLDELSSKNQAYDKLSSIKDGAYIALQNVSTYDRERFTSMLGKTYDGVKNGKDSDDIEMQISILNVLGHIHTAASNLATFVRLTRPESEGGSIGISIADIIMKEAKLNDFREKLATSKDEDLRISGMREVLKPRDVHEGWDTEYISEILGAELPEVVALNSLMLDSSLQMFMPYFPQARPSWVKMLSSILNRYSDNYYQDLTSGRAKRIAYEMILYKLLGNKKFVHGDPQEEQKRILIDVPKQLKDLKERIAKAEKLPGKDAAADELVGNVFLANLTTTSPENSSVAPRLMFSLNGAAVEGTSDLIRSYWNAMYNSSDKGIQQLALDLFKYNLYTNGFQYGMYEFSHFAPFSVMFKTPGYIDALRDVLIDDWNSDAVKERFTHYYYMNHWGESGLVPQIPVSQIPFAAKPKDVDGQVWVSTDRNPELATAILDKLYIVITQGKNNEEQILYRVIGKNAQGAVVLEKAQKLGSRNRHQQVTLQYNPTVDYREVKPVVPGNDSAWGQLDILNTHGEANIFADGRRTDLGSEYMNSLVNQTSSNAPQTLGLSFFGLEPKAKTLEKTEEKAAPAVKKTDNSMNVMSDVPMQSETLPQGLNVQNDSDETKVQNDIDNIKSIARKANGEKEQTLSAQPVQSFFGDLQGVDLNVLQQAAIRTGSETDGKLLSIVRTDENGEVITEEVPATPNNIIRARKQKVFVELNRRLREILRSKGVAVGTLTEAEALMAINGVSDFDTANVTAEGLLELIRIANGYEGEQALPEEFAHVAIAMLGREHPLVQRLLNALESSDEALREAFDGMYDEYAKRYGSDNRDKLVLEAAGKLVAKQLFRQQQVRTNVVSRLIDRIIDAIKNLFRKFRIDEVQNAIFDANNIASKVAREMLGGRLLDDSSLENIRETGEYFKAKRDISDKKDILSKILKVELKRLAIFKKRLGYQNTNQSKSYLATEAQIKKLESAILNHKTEDAIITYMNDSLDFLTETSESLDKLIKGGSSVNSICKKLNTVRDTLYSFSKIIQDVRKAIVDGEVTDSVQLTQSIDAMSGVLSKFFEKYNLLSRHYFEEMLSSVYGEAGKTVTVGRDKGRVISIQEMASRADRDITMASRWFNSLADCNDYVLKAVDDIVRDAKLRSRRRANAVRPLIEVAMSKLEKATGSKDQSFMFETEVDSAKYGDNKVHRTGRYLSAEAALNLSPAQKEFYDTMMFIKKDVDKYLPDSLTEDRKIIMLRKYTMERFKAAEGAGNKALVAWEGLKNRVMETGDNVDYDNQEVAVDFEGNRVDMLPVKYCMKGKKESYDDMSDDVATSLMSYAGMALEYNELDSCIGILENAKYASSERDVVQRTGFRTQRESIGNEQYDDTVYREPFTKKQSATNIQKALEDFFQMHIYGHIHKDEGTIGRTKFSIRKLADIVNAVTSYSQMAINIPQRLANVSTGFTQIVIESVGKGAFNAKDVAWATGIYTKESGDRLAETGKTDYDNKLSLWCELFDIHQDNGRVDPKYKKGRMSKIFNSHLLFAGLTVGEDYLACVTSLAVARNTKVKDAKGKETNLWDAYEVRYKEPTTKTGAYLSLKDGYTKLDGSPITAKDEAAFSKKVAGYNFELQGIYNLDDRSAVQQYAFGALIIMYRKWIAPALKRRYAKTHYSLLKDEYQEGYHSTMGRLIWDSLINAKDLVTENQSNAALLNIFADMVAVKNSVVLNWKNMTAYEKSNIRRSLTELGIVIGLLISTSLLVKLPPEDEKEGNSWFRNQLMANMFRLRAEIGSQAPTPMLVDEALKILKSPFAAIGPLQASMNVFNLLIPTNYWNEVKSGKYRGHTKAYKYFRELPIISMFKKVDNFIDPSPMIRYYQNDSTF